MEEGKCLSVRGLRKVYDNGKVAVDGLNLDLFEGKITALLGHNGAGKSTAIGVLTGLIPSTSGIIIPPTHIHTSQTPAHDTQTRAKIGSRTRAKNSTSDAVRRLRRVLGVCPQHDILFPQLTVMQHLRMYGMVKGVHDMKKLKEEAEQLVSELGISDKLHCKTAHMSGGQRRKLSVAIALIGGSKVVIMDEPTSGMDPWSRRHTWQVLQKHRSQRIILFTTHHIDEADILADRIAIMAEGKLQCCGSGLFLKRYYGVGYTLTAVKVPKESDSGLEDDALVTAILQHVPPAKVLSSVGLERSFRLPFQSTAAFPNLLEEIDERKDEFGISDFGLSVTTLEEVFIRVGHGEEQRDNEELFTPTLHSPASSSTPILNSQDTDSNPFTPNRQTIGTSTSTPAATINLTPVVSTITPVKNGIHAHDVNVDNLSVMDIEVTRTQSEVGDMQSSSGTFQRHMAALLKKRFIYGSRDRKSLCFQLVVPTVLFLLGLFILKASTSMVEEPELSLSVTDIFNGRIHLSTDSEAKGLRVPLPLQVLSNSTMALSMSALLSDGSLGTHAEFLTNSETFPDEFGTCAQGAEPLIDMSNFLVATKPLKEAKGATRYGAVTIAEDTTDNKIVYNILVNASALHAAPGYISTVNSAVLKTILSSTETPGTEAPAIKIRSWPLPLTVQELTAVKLLDGFTTSIMAVIAFCFIPASFAIYVVKEREVLAKRQQMISGVNALSYWLSTLLFDTLTSLLPSILAISLLFAFKVPAFTHKKGLTATIFLITLFGPSSAAFTYAVSFAFSSHSSAQNGVLLVYFITGLALMVTSFVLNLIPKTKAVNGRLKWIYRLFPGFCLGDGLASLAICIDDVCPDLNNLSLSNMSTLSPLDWDIAGADITFLILDCILYMLMTFGIETLHAFPGLFGELWGKFSKFCCYPPRRKSRYAAVQGYVRDDYSSSGEVSGDDDVINEERRVITTRSNKDLVRLQRIRKVYRTSMNERKVAVKCLSFGVPRGECFGLLGTNGAGKTSTFSILTGTLPATSGHAYVRGVEITRGGPNLCRGGLGLTRKGVGYCPQFDALLDLLTVKEHLELYGRLKGLSTESAKSLALETASEMDLNEFIDVRAGVLSGGNKRKLSVAISLVTGRIPDGVLLLDEPSTGMDPMAKRKMWRVISQASTGSKLCAVVMTTHSMEEAAALCSRIGIMVNAKLSCIGTAQHLKAKFGLGFEIDIKTELSSENDRESIAQTLVAAGVIHSNYDVHTTVIHPPYWRLWAALGGQITRNPTYDTQGVGSDETSMTRGIPLRLLCDRWLAEKQKVRLEEFIKANFEGAELVEETSPHSFRFSVPKIAGGLTLARMFRIMEEAVTEGSLQVVEYSVNQQTLESIFNTFAAHQEEDEQ